MLFSTDNLGPYIIASILVRAAADRRASSLCIVPGSPCIFFFWFYGFYVVDRNAGPTDSLMAQLQPGEGQRRRGRRCSCSWSSC